MLRDETGDNALGILGSLGDCSYFLAALAGRDSVEVPHYWAAGGQLHLSLALLMERDRRLQGQLMDLFEPEPGEEDQIAKHILAWRRMAPGAPE